MHTSSHTNVCKFLNFRPAFFSADITPEMLKICRFTKVRCSFYCWHTFLVLASFNLFEFSAAILDKGLLRFHVYSHSLQSLSASKICR